MWLYNILRISSSANEHLGCYLRKELDTEPSDSRIKSSLITELQLCSSLPPSKKKKTATETLWLTCND